MMGLTMASCSSCGAERATIDAPCPTCGAPSEPRKSASLPDLELDVRTKKTPETPRRRKAKEEDVLIELAVDPRTFFDAGLAERPLAAEEVSPPPRGAVSTAKAVAPAVGDLAFDAHLLADYGAPPRHVILSPVYAWRVLRRQRELRRAIVVRREEAARAASEAEDALVAFVDRVRPATEKLSPYA